MRLLLPAAAAITLVVALTACDDGHECVVRSDCPIGVCVDAQCVECASDDDCDRDETCHRGACDRIAVEGEGEGEGDASEGEGEGDAGEGEGEGDAGEGEGEGDGSFSCGPVSRCDAGERCVSLDDDTNRSCFEPCTPDTSCTTSLSEAGACEVVDGAHVCVAVAPSDGLCGSLGNARCGAPQQCLAASDVVESCFTLCPNGTGCGSNRECLVLDTTNICVRVSQLGELCGVEADGGFSYCDPGPSLACDFANGLSGHCVPFTGEGEGEGEGEGDVGPGEGEGEGEGEPQDTCIGDLDCKVFSFASGSCTTTAQCNAPGEIPLDVCAKTTNAGGRCVLKSSADPRCEELPEQPPLATIAGIDVDNLTMSFCGVADSHCVNHVCEGSAFAQH